MDASLDARRPNVIIDAMAARKTIFANEEFYHVYNRGVDKRNIFLDDYDRKRFFQSMTEFNVVEPIGSIYEKTIADKSLGRLASKSKDLVNFIAYCLNPNHYHFVLEQKMDDGIEKFMHRLGTGYSKYFNNKYQRGGALFQSKFKSVYINSNEYLLHLSVYVNLNYNFHPEKNGNGKLGRLASKFAWSSWDEYCGRNNLNFCRQNIILDQFNNQKEYEEFAQKTLGEIIERKKSEKEWADLMID